MMKHMVCKEIILRILTGNYYVFKQIISREIRGVPNRILDLGCGTGILSGLFGDRAYTGIDIDTRIITYAKRRYPRKKFFVMDGTSLSFPDKLFDTIIIVGVIHHLNDTQAKHTVRQVQRVLKPGGMVVAIEAIQPLSRFNIPGRLLRAFDEGNYIRTLDEYVTLFNRLCPVKKAYTRHGGLFDYAVCVLRMSSTLKRSIS